jgi:uncharacterized cupredoxin-like copper-binding protein
VVPLRSWAAKVVVGKSAEVVWTFPAEGALEFACNVPGHYAAGMAGDFVLSN